MAVLTRDQFNQQYKAAREQGMDRHQAINYLAQAAIAAQPYNRNKSSDNGVQAVDTWKPGDKVLTRSEFNAQYGHSDQPAYGRQSSQQPVYNANAALANLQRIASTTTDKQLAKTINKYTKGDAKKDNFWGQTAASFGSGQINELYNQAAYRASTNPSDKNAQAVADAYKQLSEYYNTVNAEALDDKNRKAGWLSKDLAQYAPQFIEQTKAGGLPTAIGAGIGLLAGLAIPTVGEEGATTAAGAAAANAVVKALSGGLTGTMGGTVAGTKVGSLVGSAKYSYETMRGAAYMNMREAAARKGINLSDEEMVAAANDEAIVSSAIENIDNALDYFALIPGMGNAAKKLSLDALKGLKGVVARWGANVGQEGLEEFTQEVISIANERRAEKGDTDTGILGLIEEVGNVVGEMTQNTESGKMNLNQALEAARGGAIIGGFMGPAGAVVNNVVTGPVNNAVLNTINNIDPNKQRARQNTNILANNAIDSQTSEEIDKRLKDFNKIGRDVTDEYRHNFEQYATALDNLQRGHVLTDRDGNAIGQVTGLSGKGFGVTLFDKNGKPKGKEYIFKSGISGMLESDGTIYNALKGGGGFITEQEYNENIAQREAEARRAAERATAEATAAVTETPEAMATPEEAAAPVETAAATPVEEETVTPMPQPELVADEVADMPFAMSRGEARTAPQPTPSISLENAPQSASPEESNSIPPKAKESSEVPSREFNSKPEAETDNDVYLGDEVAFLNQDGKPIYWDMRDQNHDQLIGAGNWEDRYGLHQALRNGYIRVKAGNGIELSFENGRLTDAQEKGIKQIIDNFTGDVFYVDGDIEQEGDVRMFPYFSKSFEGAEIDSRKILSWIDKTIREHEDEIKKARSESSERASTAQNAKSETNIRAKERLSDNDELALLEGGSTKHSRQVKAQSSSEALTPAEVSSLTDREVNQRLNKYAALARTAATGDNAIDVLLNFLGGNMKPETSVQNVDKAFYEQSLRENVFNDYDEDYVPPSDGRSTFQPTDEQIQEILTLIERKQTSAQEYREARNPERENTIPPDERKRQDNSPSIDRNFGAVAEDAEIPEMFLPDDDSMTALPYDPNKVKEFMAERNDDNVAERLELLRELFPDADFRISHDYDYTLDERAKLPSDYLIADEVAEGDSVNKSNGEAFIELVRGHNTYGSTTEPVYKGDKYEKSWMGQHGWADAISDWKEEGNDKTQVYSSFELVPNGHFDKKTGEWKSNKALTDTKADGKLGNRQHVESLVVTKADGTRQVYYLKSKDGMYRHIINSNISEGITKVIQRHEAKVKELEQRIENGYLFAEHPNQFLDSKDINANTTEKALQLVKKLEADLEKEKNWLRGLDYNRDNNYTLAKFFADNKGVVTQADKDLVKSYLNEDIGRDISGFSFQGLGNSMSKDFAMELIDSIFEEGTNGQTQPGESGNSTSVDGAVSQAGLRRFEVSGAGKTGSGEWNPAAFRTAEGRQPSSISERTEAFGLRTANGNTRIENSPAQASAPDLRRSAGTGTVMDDPGTVRPLFGETSGVQTRNISVAKKANIFASGLKATQDINRAEESSLTIRKRGGKPGATINAKQLNSDTFLNGEAIGTIDPDKYEGRVRQVAEAIKNAAQEYGLATVQLKGDLFRQHTAKDGSNYTSNLNAYADLNVGFIAIGELTEENAGKILNDALHEITHGVTDEYFGVDNDQTITFVKRLAEQCKIKDFGKKIQKVIDAYSDDGTFNYDVADELICRIAEGDNCGDMFTQSELEKLQDALFNSNEWKEATKDAGYYNQLADFSRTKLRNKIEPEAQRRVRPPTEVGFDVATPPSQQARMSKVYYPVGERETNRTSSERTKQFAADAARALMLGDFDAAQELIKKASSLPKDTDTGMVSDEMAEMYLEKVPKELRNQKAFRFKEDIEGDIDDVMRLVEEDRKKPNLADYLASRRDGTAEAESQERLFTDVEEDFEKYRETNPEPRQATQEERFGVKGDDNPLNLAKKASEQAKRLKQTSVLNNTAKRSRMFGSNKAVTRATDKFNRYIDLLDNAANAKADVAELFAYASTMKGDAEVGVYMSDKIIDNLRKAAQLEEESLRKPTPDVVNAYKYQATKAMAMAAQHAANVDNIQTNYQSGLIEAALKYSKGNEKNALVQAAQWLNRMQLNPGNFFRMIGGYDKGSNNSGYVMQKWVDRQNAVRITTESKAKDFFSGVKKDKQFNDFATGKTMTNIEMGGKKLNLLQAVQFKMLCDTLGIDDFRNSRLETLNGFALRTSGGKDTFVEFEGGNQTERYAWVNNLYNQAVKAIDANSAAKDYMESAVAMFEDIKGDLIRTGEQVDGFPRDMYSKGKYLPLTYASKDGHPTDWTLTDDMNSGLSATRIMQERVRDNGGYAVIRPISQTVDSYISQASNYIAYAELGNALSIMSDANSLYGDIGQTIGKNFGETYAQWLKNYTKDINQIKTEDPTGLNKFLSKSRNWMMQGALLGSVSVPIKQISSYFSAMGIIDPRAVAKAWVPIARKSGNYIVDSFYNSRRQGSLDPDVSQALNSGWVDKLRKSGKLGAAVVNATNTMDARTVANVYYAACLDIEMNSGLTKAEIYKNGNNLKAGLTNAGEYLVHAKFSEAVLNTQPIFTKQARAELARTSNELLRMLSTFRTQQTQNYNRLLTTINEAKAAKKYGGNTAAANREMRQTIAGQIAGAASISALTILADLVLHKHKKYKDDDDEEKLDWGKVLNRWTLNFGEAAAGTALFGSEISKWLIDQASGNTGEYASNKEFYGISMGSISSLKSVMNAWNWLYSDMLKGSKHVASNARYVINYTATMFGIPVQNAYNIINSLYQFIGDGIGRDVISNYTNNKYEDMLKEWDAIRNDYGNKLYNAVRDKNLSKAAAAKEQMGDNFKSIIKKSSLEQLESGDADDDEVINTLMTYAEMSEKDAEEAVRTMHLTIDTGYTSLTGTGDKTAETAYTKGTLSRAEYKKLMTKYSDKTSDKAEYSINRIDFKQAYPKHTYQDIKDMYLNGQLSRAEAINWRVKTQENATRDSAENYFKNVDFQKMTGYDANYTSKSDLYDTYETKAKLGVISFYDKYGSQFKSPKDFGSVFNYLNNNERTSYPTYQTGYGEASSNQNRVITLLNDLISSGRISYQMAKTIWSEHYGWSTGSRSAWINVKG